MVYREIVCSSWGREGDSGAPVFLLPQPIYVSRFKVISVSVPLVEFSIDETCNKIVITDVNGGNAKTVVIPSGSYSSGNIVSTLQTAINAVAGQAYSVTYNEPQRTLSISAPSAFKILGGKGGSTAYQVVGLDKRTELGPGSSLTMPNQIDLNVCKVMLLKSRGLKSKYSLFASQPGLNPLCVITSDMNNEYAYVGGVGSDWLWAQVTLSELDFQIVDGTTLLPIKGLENLGFVVTIGILDDDILDAGQ